MLPKVAAYEEELKLLGTYELRKRSLSLRYRAAQPEPLESILPEAFALVREAGRRTLNMRHFDVQIWAASPCTTARSPRCRPAKARR